MGANRRIRALKLLEKQKKYPEFTTKLGIEVKIVKVNDGKDCK